MSKPRTWKGWAIVSHGKWQDVWHAGAIARQEAKLYPGSMEVTVIPVLITEVKPKGRVKGAKS